MISLYQEGIKLVEKIILDRQLIYHITRRKDTVLIIQYNTRNKRAWYKTDTMTKRKPISLSRVVDL